jgi:hypothetical protein
MSTTSPPVRPLNGGKTYPRAAEHRNNTTQFLLTTPIQTDNIYPGKMQRGPRHWAVPHWGGEGGVCFFVCQLPCSRINCAVTEHDPIVEDRVEGLGLFSPLVLAFPLLFFFSLSLSLSLSFSIHFSRRQLSD